MMNQHRKSSGLNKLCCVMAVLLFCLPASAQNASDKNGDQRHNRDLQTILNSDPDSAEAMRLYIRWLQEPNEENLDLLKKNDLVEARAIWNGYHAFGLPNGLEAFLTSYDFGDKYLKILPALQNPKTTMTLEDAAEIWTKGYEVAGGSELAKGLRKLNADYRNELKSRLGFPAEYLLSNFKLSQLSSELRSTLVNVQREYASKVGKLLHIRSEELKNGAND